MNPTGGIGSVMPPFSVPTEDSSPSAELTPSGSSVSTSSPSELPSDGVDSVSEGDVVVNGEEEASGADSDSDSDSASDSGSDSTSDSDSDSTLDSTLHSTPSSSITPSHHRKRVIPLTKNVLGRYSKWEDHINSYRSIQEASLSLLSLTRRSWNTSNIITYVKRGTTGISGQLIGICDALFIGFYTKRAVRCDLSLPSLQIVTSNVITDDLFVFGLPHMHLNLSAQELSSSSPSAEL